MVYYVEQYKLLIEGEMFDHYFTRSDKWISYCRKYVEYSGQYYYLDVRFEK